LKQRSGSGRESGGSRGGGLCLRQAVPIPTTFLSTLICCKDDHSPARLENQVMPLCSGAVHGLACGISATFLLAQPKPLPSPLWSAPMLAVFQPQQLALGPWVLDKLWPWRTALLFPKRDQGSAMAPVFWEGGLWGRENPL